MPAIKHYSTSAKGVGGEIKRRISDFLVNEITPEMEACEIQCFTPDEKKEVEIEWPEAKEGEDQLIMIMEKFNYDVNNAIRRIARSQGISIKRFGYAGMKDKRAITAQRLSFWNPDIEKLKEFRSRYIALRDPKWAKERVKIGDLYGNEFVITIRNIKLDKKETEKRIKSCIKEMDKGIANYFGEQRFGGARKISHLVGREFVRRNFEDAVMLYLTSTFPGEEEEIRNARLNLQKSGDFSQAIKEFPKKFRYERSIIHHLCKYPKDFIGAFKKLPSSLCYLFTHAYQSYIFNKVINERIEQGLGLEVTEGDILKEGLATATLIGFESELATGKAGEIERKVLAEENITKEDFRVKEFSEMSSKGARKEILLKPENLKLLKVEDDEFNENCVKATISLRLKKGNYATTVMREIMKADNND